MVATSCAASRACRSCSEEAADRGSAAGAYIRSPRRAYASGLVALLGH